MSERRRGERRGEGRVAIKRKSCCYRLYFRNSFSNIVCSLITKFVLRGGFAPLACRARGQLFPSALPLLTPLETIKIDVYK